MVEERAGSKLFDFAQSAGPDEAYDAAMRAADAFFSIRSDAPPPQAEALPSSETGPTGNSTDKSSGRILRVIDEAPLPELHSLEAERSPKRRGRKPGSKNKPKPQVLAALTGLRDPKPEARKTVAPPAVAAFAASAAQTKPAISSHSAAANAAPSTSRGAKRFPWIRDRLKPGEDWKRRRLPRICW